MSIGKGMNLGSQGEFAAFAGLLNAADVEQRGQFVAKLKGGARLMEAFKTLAGSLAGAPPLATPFDIIDRNWFGHNSGGTSMWLVEAIYTPEEIHALIRATAVELIGRMEASPGSTVQILGTCTDPEGRVEISEADGVIRCEIYAAYSMPGDRPYNEPPGWMPEATSRVLEELAEVSSGYEGLSDEERRLLVADRQSELGELAYRINISKNDRTVATEWIPYYGTVLARRSFENSLHPLGDAQRSEANKLTLRWPPASGATTAN